MDSVSAEATLGRAIGTCASALDSAARLTPSVMLTSVEVRRKWVLSVEDWAGIRRLYRSERMQIKVIARRWGVRGTR